MRINSHVYRPRKVRFLGGASSYHLGVELEVEAPSSRALDVGISLRRAGAMYAKTDDSLNYNGVELVTHPIAHKQWLSKRAKGPVATFLQYVTQLKTMGFTSHSNGRCGLHIHVSRTAMRDRPHLYWFGRLINNDLFHTISQRAEIRTELRELRFCEREVFTVAKVQSKPPISECRYRALNLCNIDTLEVRIFRGNMREERIRKAVEAVIAGVEFTRSLTSRDWGIDLSPAFQSYVQTRKTLYPNLSEYLHTTNITEPVCA